MITQNAQSTGKFSRKAVVYATAPELDDEQALQLLAATADVSSRDEVLDVACGPGVLSCYLARRTRSVVGIDRTTATLDQARRSRSESGIENISFFEGDFATLPFEDESFTLVASRYALHHASEPARVLSEMGRVMRRAGRIAIADIALPDDPGLAKIFNAAERMRDPTHVRAFTISEHLDLYRADGWTVKERAAYSIDRDLGELIEASGRPAPEQELMRRLYEARPARSERERLVRTRGGVTRLSYPISIFVLAR